MIKQRIIELRNSIRYARDQKLDDRCWLDYYMLYQLLPGTNPININLLSQYDVCMQICTSFYHRRSGSKDPIPSDAILNSGKWDEDIIGMDIRQQLREINIITMTGMKHRDRFPELTIDDDRELYSVLPEKIPADFRLPPEEEFLQGINPEAGCPNFWKSHKNCQKCRILPDICWGPCE